METQRSASQEQTMLKTQDYNGRRHTLLGTRLIVFLIEFLKFAFNPVNQDRISEHPLLGRFTIHPQYTSWSKIFIIVVCKDIPNTELPGEGQQIIVLPRIFGVWSYDTAWDKFIQWFFWILPEVDWQLKPKGRRKDQEDFVSFLFSLKKLSIIHYRPSDGKFHLYQRNW